MSYFETLWRHVWFTEVEYKNIDYFLEFLASEVCVIPERLSLHYKGKNEF